MSKEKEGGFFSQLKNQIITGAGVILTGLGTMFMDEVKSFIGIEDEDEGVAKTEMIQEQKQEVNVTGPAITINIPEQKKDTVVKKVYVKPKPKLTETEKRKKEGLDW
jgi:hypothetical protein